MNVIFVKSAFKPDQYPPADRPEVAFAGRSNVGKSSLINVLVQRRNLARTGSTPGRTQSINFFSLDDRLHLVDLPGYGFARVPREVQQAWKPMVEAYLQERKTLRAVVVILDIRRDPSGGDLDLLQWLRAYGIPAVVVLTKADKLSRQKAKSRAGKLGRELATLSAGRPVLFSAKSREGRGDIWRRIEEVVGKEAQRPVSKP
ncbi:MAG: ribosome biogenesis GTP-binding protein YihA/YsxC [Deltaproteobacteria bacterium]|nr:ribosome biogenesis GTP-binding protein YihA/YsxC [Deltaproteobacteria bacterium]